MRLRTCLFFVVLFTFPHAFADDLKSFRDHFKLLPEPQQVTVFNGKGLTAGGLAFIFTAGEFKRPVLGPPLDRLPAADRSGHGILTLEVDQSGDVPVSNEGYVLEVHDNAVLIRARGGAGLFYGCQTLVQLLQDASEEHIEIPACRITDYPDIPYRAVHLDLKHHLDAGHYYYYIIDELASVKINAVIVEFEDKLRYRKCPVVGSSDAISVEEFAAISRYAKDRNIEISPLVQGLGHASFILKHDEYKDLRDDPRSDWSFDPLNPKTYEVQFSLYEDAIAATPYGRYLHVGGDEVGNLGMSAEARKSGLSPMQLQMMWLNKVCAFAKAHNRIPIFWDDMVFKICGLYQTTWDATVPFDSVSIAWNRQRHTLDENIALFPKNCIYMRWNYDTPGLPGNLQAIDWYNSHQLTVWAATAAQTMWPLMPRNQSNFQPIKAFCGIAAKKKLSGILCTAWDDCSPHFETYWRGFYDFAFFSWHYMDVPAAQLHTAFRQRFYGVVVADSSFGFQDMLEASLPFWETAFIENGDRNNYHKDFQLITLPDTGKPGEWSLKYKDRVAMASGTIKRFNEIKSKIEAVGRKATRNRYNLEVMDQINELQVYPARVFMELAEYDTAHGTEREAAKQKILSTVADFDRLRRKFEEVYATTRILDNPADYQLDQNRHEHLANGTRNDDWMFLYEIAMNKQLLDRFR